MENIIKNPENITPSLNGENVEKNMQTYFLMGSEQTGLVEIDLVSLRQRNEQSKYLSFKIVEPASDDSEPITSTFYLDNEEAFILLKNFFMQLSWNE